MGDRSRYIDTSKVVIPKGFFEQDLNVPKLFDWLYSQPAADVVEVVMCKDCEYLMDRNGFCWCEEHSDGFGSHVVYVDKDDFCSFGIKKED